MTRDSAEFREPTRIRTRRLTRSDSDGPTESESNLKCRGPHRAGRRGRSESRWRSRRAGGRLRSCRAGRASPTGAPGPARHWQPGPGLLSVCQSSVITDDYAPGPPAGPARAAAALDMESESQWPGGGYRRPGHGHSRADSESLGKYRGTVTVT